MPRPTLLKHIDSTDNPHDIMDWVQATDENPEDYHNPLPINADTFKGHPFEDFALVGTVSQLLHEYISTVLGKSY